MVAAGMVMVQGQEVSLSASAASSDAGDEAGPKLGDLVAAARSKALEVSEQQLAVPGGEEGEQDVGKVYVCNIRCCNHVQLWRGVE